MVAIVQPLPGPTRRPPHRRATAATTLRLVADDVRRPRPTTLRRASAATYRRRRLVAVLGAALLVLATALVAPVLATGFGGASLPAPEAGPAPGAGAAATGSRVHVVAPGDTLWSIAADLAPDGDVRATVDRLVAVNAGPDLEVGQRVMLG